MVHHYDCKWIPYSYNFFSVARISNRKFAFNHVSMRVNTSVSIGSEFFAIQFKNVRDDDRVHTEGEKLQYSRARATVYVTLVVGPIHANATSNNELYITVTNANRRNRIKISPLSRSTRRIRLAVIDQYSLIGRISFLYLNALLCQML